MNIYYTVGICSFRKPQLQLQTKYLELAYYSFLDREEQRRRRMLQFNSLKMGCSFAGIPLLILLISTLISFNAQGRRLSPTPDNSEMMKESKILWRAQIGSRPPRCERRCGSCARCQAIQVPTNPQISGGAVAAARDESSSNYKPMSWKCKCGNLIFNP